VGYHRAPFARAWTRKTASRVFGELREVLQGQVAVQSRTAPRVAGIGAERSRQLTGFMPTTIRTSSLTLMEDVLLVLAQPSVLFLTWQYKSQKWRRERARKSAAQALPFPLVAERLAWGLPVKRDS